MSVDFGGNLIFKKQLNSGVDFVFAHDRWSDNKCGWNNGYARIGLIFESEKKYICYLVNESIFAGVPRNECIKIVDKTTGKADIYGLKPNLKNELADKPEYKDLPPLLLKDVEIIEQLDYEYDGEDDITLIFPKMAIPKIDGGRQAVVLYLTTGIMAFEFDGSLNDFDVLYFANGCGIRYALKAFTEIELTKHILRANKILAEVDSGKIKNPKKEVFFKSGVSLQTVKDCIKPEESQDDAWWEDKEKRAAFEENIRICQTYNDLIRVDPVKLPALATLEGNKLIFNGDYDVITNHLAQYVLIGFGLSGDEDLNNYNYSDEVLKSKAIDLVIPKGVKCISDQAFVNKRFKSITFEEGLEEICRCAFADIGVKEVHFPSTLKKLGERAFRDFTLDSVYIPAACTDIGRNAIRANKLIVDKNNPVYASAENCGALIDKRTATLTLGGADFIVPQGVKIIDSRAFWRIHSKGDELIIPEGVEIIEEYAFCACYLAKVKFPTTLKVIKESAFEHNCFKEIELNEGLERVEKGAFELCDISAVKADINTKFDPEAFGQAYYNKRDITVHLSDGTSYTVCGNQFARSGSRFD